MYSHVQRAKGITKLMKLQIANRFVHSLALRGCRRGDRTDSLRIRALHSRRLLQDCRWNIHEVTGEVEHAVIVNDFYRCMN